MIFTKMMDSELVREVVEGLPNIELKLSILGMLNDIDFVEALMQNNFNDAILPYAKVRFSNNRR